MSFFCVCHQYITILGTIKLLQFSTLWVVFGYKYDQVYRYVTLGYEGKNKKTSSAFQNNQKKKKNTYKPVIFWKNSF